MGRRRFGWWVVMATLLAVAVLAHVADPVGWSPLKVDPSAIASADLDRASTGVEHLATLSPRPPRPAGWTNGRQPLRIPAVVALALAATGVIGVTRAQLARLAPARAPAALRQRRHIMARRGPPPPA